MLLRSKSISEEMKVIQRKKINPAAGCLPVLIQMPILIGFYHAISRMNDTPEIDLGRFLWFELSGTKYYTCNLAGAYAINCFTYRSSNG